MVNTMQLIPEINTYPRLYANAASQVYSHKMTESKEAKKKRIPNTINNTPDIKHKRKITLLLLLERVRY